MWMRVLYCFLFFFSSRRRHTRSKRDWSSDVCSSDLVPVGPEGRSPVPRHRGAHNAHGEAYNAAHQGVLHGPIGREPGNEVAAHDAIDGAIDRRKQQGRVEADHRLAPWREDAGHVQHDVGCKGEYDAHEYSGKHGANASTNASRMLRFAHDPAFLHASRTRRCERYARILSHHPGAVPTFSGWSGVTNFLLSPDRMPISDRRSIWNGTGRI